MKSYGLKKLGLKEKLEVYENVLHMIIQLEDMPGFQKPRANLISLLRTWSAAHAKNGLPEKHRQENILLATTILKDALDKIF